MRRVRTIVLATCAVLSCACGCGDDDVVAPGSDAGADGARPLDGGGPPSDLTLPTGATLALPMPPAPPAPPVLTPCRAGWREVPGTDLPATCDPWPASGRAACAAGEAHFPGEPACRAVGSACPASGDWPEGLPAGTPVVYVQASAASGGSGTRTAPFRTIVEGVAAAMPGSIVAVARGTYDEAVTLPAGVSLRGACARDTVVAYSRRDAAAATVRVTGASVEVRDVQVGGARSGLLVDAGGDATIAGVWIAHATETGLRVHRGAHASIDDLLVTDVGTDPDDRESAFGIVVELAGSAVGSRIVVERARQLGIIVDGAGSTLSLDDVAVLDTSPSAGSNAYGVGIGAQAGGAIVVRGGVVDGASFAGLGAGIDGATLTVEDVVVRNVTADGDGGGAGLQASESGTTRVTRALVEHARQGVRAEAGATLTVDHALLRELAGGAAGTGTAGEGVLVRDRATATLSHVRVDRASYVGLGAFVSATATLSDLTVTRTQPDTAMRGGAGVSAQGGSVVRLTRALLADNRWIAANAANDGTELGLTDVAIRDTRPDAAMRSLGRGMEAALGASIDVTRVRIERCLATGAIAVSRGSIRGTDLEVLDTRAGETGSWAGIGIGLDAQDGSTLDLERVRIAQSVGWGLKVDEPASTVTLRDLVVQDTAPWARAPMLDTLVGRGTDVAGAEATFERAIVERSREMGMFFSGGAATLDDVVVRDGLGDMANGTGGFGIGASGDAVVSARDVLLARSRDTGLFVATGGRFTGARVRILDTLASVCATSTCAARPGGIGASAILGGAIDLTDFTVSGAALCGVQVVGADLDLRSGRVDHCPIGANVQDPGFDFARLSDRVVYADNERNLDSATLPVPTPSSPIAVVETP